MVNLTDADIKLYFNENIYSIGENYIKREILYFNPSTHSIHNLFAKNFTPVLINNFQ